MADAIRSGIFNDLGSGSNVDLVIITKDRTEILRNYDKPNPRPYTKKIPYNFPHGTTPTLSTITQPVLNRAVVIETTVVPNTTAAMEVAH